MEEMCHALDTNSDGALSAHDLHGAWAQLGSSDKDKASDADIQRVFAAMERQSQAGWSMGDFLEVLRVGGRAGM
jgi:Ca2+-binding EF-hand superfamily protein